jgi:putative endonuclease
VPRTHFPCGLRATLSSPTPGTNMFYIYILQSLKDRKLYVGYTSDLKKRFMEHKKGVVASTKNRRPLILIYYEAYRSEKDARIREKFLKTGKGREFIKNNINYSRVSAQGVQSKTDSPRA